jgi:hypothetical protein
MMVVEAKELGELMVLEDVPVKDTAKARPRRCPSPSFSPNNIEAFPQGNNSEAAARSQ